MANENEREARRFSRWLDAILPSCIPYEYTNKQRAIAQKISYMLDRTQAMFEWEGLPDTIPQRILELYLQVNGNVCWYKHNNDLYVFTGGLGGVPDVYYRPTIYTIANPALNLTQSVKIGEECEVMLNDSMLLGLLPMCSEYATGMTETELSIDMAKVNLRIFDLISAPDDRTRESALKYLSDIREGKMGAIAENKFLEGIRTQPYASTGSNSIITDLIELMQYEKASWYNEIGLNANYNMKRESLNSSESQLNNDALLPLVDDMLRCRQEGCDRVNAMFGTNISVKLASSWEDNVQEIELEHEQLESEEESTEASPQVGQQEELQKESEGGEVKDEGKGEVE